MSSNAEVTKSGSESALSLIRKFSRRVQGAGIIPSVRGQRYHARVKSKTVKKKQALKRIARRTEFQKLLREGKVVEPTRRGHARREQPQTTAQAESAAQKRGGLGDAPIAR